MSHVFELAAYSTSRDYARLADLMTRRAIICVLDNDGCRDVAKTSYADYGDGVVAYEIGSRGIGYLWARKPETSLRSADGSTSNSSSRRSKSEQQPARPRYS
jgi:hypothetical protein